ncbi:pyridoxamine 5'-phosphate oxidase family protein [Alteribacillus iranensis]|uniref:Pyridoxamine 5'-phosphate oxidase n=1 Tax=Alteribacillus iranensis TaxID=930128 RepID=A0A1I2AED0_9BACI|nr:pyridoxamine 5'-phosphate oxidase family protein [Alteribacillus iranensis]SFE42331.1 Pyridoxamine 5'-phosphate oxidase [Alteribacillus iranensis]
MSANNQQQLTDELLQQLREETFVSLITVDHETGNPYVSAISWVYAPDRQTIRFSIDNGSKNIMNVKKHAGIVLTIIDNGTTYAISGNASIIEENMDNIPIDLALMECRIEEIRDIMFYGGKLVNEPDVEKTYDEEAAEKLDNQVMNALKEA